MNEKTMKFTDEQGNKVEYAILEQKLITKAGMLQWHQLAIKMM